MSAGPPPCCCGSSQQVWKQEELAGSSIKADVKVWFCKMSNYERAHIASALFLASLSMQKKMHRRMAAFATGAGSMLPILHGWHSLAHHVRD